MATQDPAKIRYLSGRLVANPTDLSAAFPHGGTELGTVRRLVFTARSERPPVRAEEFGGAEVEYIRGAQDAALAAVLREWDPDAIAAVFPNTATGSVSGKPVLRGQVFGAGVTKPGTLASDKALVVLVSPDATDRAEGLILPNALPMPEEQLELQFAIGVEAGLALVFRAVPHATSGKTFELGRIRDLEVP